MGRWIFTKKRQDSLKAARAEHSRIVKLGLAARRNRRYGKS